MRQQQERLSTLKAKMVWHWNGGYTAPLGRKGGLADLTQHAVPIDPKPHYLALAAGQLSPLLNPTLDASMDLLLKGLSLRMTRPLAQAPTQTDGQDRQNHKQFNQTEPRPLRPRTKCRENYFQ